MHTVGLQIVYVCRTLQLIEMRDNTLSVIYYLLSILYVNSLRVAQIFRDMYQVAYDRKFVYIKCAFVWFYK